MTNTARETILSNLRNSSPVKEFEASDFSILEEKKLNGEEKITRYKEVTKAVNTEVFEIERATWITEIEGFVKQKKIRQLMYGPNSDFGNKLEEKWQGDETKLLPYQHVIEECKDVLFEVDASITSTLGAIAETGSLMMWPTKDEPRLLSLTPPIHIAVVSADQFYTTFYEAIEANNWADNMPTNALLVSGPSKTADIEQELCYGVHGPKELIVFIVH